MPSLELIDIDADIDGVVEIVPPPLSSSQQEGSLCITTENDDNDNVVAIVIPNNSNDTSTAASISVDTKKKDPPNRTKRTKKNTKTTTIMTPKTTVTARSKPSMKSTPIETNEDTTTTTTMSNRNSNHSHHQKTTTTTKKSSRQSTLGSFFAKPTSTTTNSNNKIDKEGVSSNSNKKKKTSSTSSSSTITPPPTSKSVMTVISSTTDVQRRQALKDIVIGRCCRRPSKETTTTKVSSLQEEEDGGIPTNPLQSSSIPTVSSNIANEEEEEMTNTNTNDDNGDVAVVESMHQPLKNPNGNHFIGHDTDDHLHHHQNTTLTTTPSATTTNTDSAATVVKMTKKRKTSSSASTSSPPKRNTATKQTTKHPTKKNPSSLFTKSSMTTHRVSLSPFQPPASMVPTMATVAAIQDNDNDNDNDPTTTSLLTSTKTPPKTLKSTTRPNEMDNGNDTCHPNDMVMIAGSEKAKQEEATEDTPNANASKTSDTERIIDALSTPIVVSDDVVITSTTTPVESDPKIRTLRCTYQQRLQDTITRCHNDGIPEEQILFTSLEAFLSSDNKTEIVPPPMPEEPDPSNAPNTSTLNTGTTSERISTMTSFPDYAIQTLVHIVEGQSMPLDTMVTIATKKLNQHYTKQICRNTDDDGVAADTTTPTPVSSSSDTSVLFTEDIVAAKLQLVATRNHMMKGIMTSLTKLATKNVDDTTFVTILSLLDQDRMYRWEIVTPSVDSYMVFFPNVTCRTNVKKARAARKKVTLYCTTLTKMLSQLSDIESQLTQSQQQGTDNNDEIQKKLWSRFQADEERIHKMDREYEANRITEIARMEKLEMDRKHKELLQQKKVEAALARQKEKEDKQQQILQAKAEAAQQQKILKEAAALSKKAASTKNENATTNSSKNNVSIKQKQCMMSFLSKRTSLTSTTAILDPPGVNLKNSPEHERQPLLQPTHHPTMQNIHSVASREDGDQHQTQSKVDSPINFRANSNSAPFHESFDVDAFRKGIAGAPSTLMTGVPNVLARSHLSARAKCSRQRRECISVPVFVTIYPSNDYDCDNPFLLQQQQPYAEQVHITIQNRYKFLSFCEDVRPPYYGTWSKKSKFITGKKPFGIDTAQLDYDVDSEGEWEEEDGDIGEEIGDDGMEDEEEKEVDDDDEDDEDDGWLAADDEIDDDDDDDADSEDIELGKELKSNSKRKITTSSRRDTSSVCIISPCQGRPLSKFAVDKQAENDRIDGIRPSDAIDLLDGFVAVQICDTNFNVDAYPPPIIDENDISMDPQASDKNQPMSEESMKTFAKFVHNCTYGSKDKVLDELLQTHPSLTNTRAQAYRVLDTIAEKKKHPCDGSYFWEVKSEILDSLGLTGVVKGIEIEDMKQEAMKAIVRCVHNSTLASKEKIVDEIRSNYEHVTASRAEAMRIVQSIATKVKHPNGGYYWIVNEEIRNDLDMDSYPNKCPIAGIATLDEETDINANHTEEQSKRKHNTPTLHDSTDQSSMVRAIFASGSHDVEAEGKLTTVNILPPRKKPKIGNKEHGSSKILATFIKKAALPDKI